MKKKKKGPTYILQRSSLCLAGYRAVSGYSCDFRYVTAPYFSCLNHFLDVLVLAGLYMVWLFSDFAQDNSRQR